jgi:tripartite-type tricarboxylate transporter receptor subunit TctC
VILARRRFLRLAASAAALPVLSRRASAQTYPARPVRFVDGFAPGGSADIVARLIAEQLSARLGQPFVVENRPGVASNIATELVVRAAPDGYTLLLVTAVNANNASLYDNLKFDLIRDIVPIVGIDRIPLVMEVNPSVPARTVPEFIAYAKANPGKINMGSTGIGSTTHLAGELFMMMAGVELVHVPYRGEALADLLAGHVQVHFGTLPGSIELIRAGTLRALAVTTQARLEVLPDVPTIGEFLAGYEASGWQGIGAPRGTSADVVDRINRAVNAALADAKIKSQLADLGATVLGGTPEGFGRLIADDTGKWAKVIRFAHIKVE